MKSCYAFVVASMFSVSVFHLILVLTGFGSLGMNIIFWIIFCALYVTGSAFGIYSQSAEQTQKNSPAPKLE